MLEISTGIVCRIIDRAREFHAQEGVVIPDTASGSELDSDQVMQVLAAHADDLTYQELKSSIQDLEPQQQVDLVSLMWVGRGDFDAGEFDEARQQAREQWTPHTADYLLATPLVADFLNDGLSALGFSCDNNDRY